MSLPPIAILALPAASASLTYGLYDLFRSATRLRARVAHKGRALVGSGSGQRLLRAGGGTSRLDLTLYLITRLVDLETAPQCARLDSIDWHDVGQLPSARLAQLKGTLLGKSSPHAR